MSSTSETPKIHLKTSDGELFDVDEPIAMELGIVKQFFDDNTDADAKNGVVPLPNVKAKQLSQIIVYCTKLVDFKAKLAPEHEREAYGAEFVKDMKDEEIKEMIMAANFLNIKELLDALCRATADLIKNQIVEYVRQFFGITNDFTEEEEANLRAQNEWAFKDIERDH